MEVVLLVFVLFTLLALFTLSCSPLSGKGLSEGFTIRITTIIQPHLSFLITTHSEISTVGRKQHVRSVGNYLRKKLLKYRYFEFFRNFRSKEYYRDWSIVRQRARAPSAHAMCLAALTAEYWSPARREHCALLLRGSYYHILAQKVSDRLTQTVSHSGLLVRRFGRQVGPRSRLSPG